MNTTQRTFAFSLMLGLGLMSYGCSNDDFSATGERGQASADLNSAQKRGQQTDGDDSGDAGIDEDGDNGKNDGDSDSDDDDNVGNDDDSDDDDDDASDSDCRFFADEDYLEKIEGGPDLELSLKDLKGHWENGKYVFTFDAWQGAMGATAQIHEGSGPMITIGGGADLPDYPAAIADLMPKDKDHWQLTPVMMNGVHKYGVKHSYQGVINNAKSSSCEISLTETITPFLDRTGGGCFALTTNIRLADGRDRYVALLNVGDMILNPTTGKAARIAAITSGPEADQQMIRVGYGAYSVLVTQKHPMQTAAGLKQARSLTSVDRILGADGQYHAVATLAWQPVNSQQVVRNIVINPDSSDPRDHMVLADGIVTGDLYLQRQLEETVGTQSRVVAKLLTNFAAY